MSVNVSTIASDRITRLRRRIADGSYRVDHRLLAEVLASHDDRQSAAMPAPDQVRSAAVAMLQAALTALTPRAAMLLQLHFVEQLRGAEAARVMDFSEQRAIEVRRQALHRLHAIVDAA